MGIGRGLGWAGSGILEDMREMVWAAVEMGMAGEGGFGEIG